MTLMELEKLVRRIEGALDNPAPTDTVDQLAADYNSVSRAASLRLGQCASMLSLGDEHQALQLAETAPALLDQLTLLSFRRSPAWRELCASANLPVAEKFDLKAVRQINELYAKGIDKDHALYRDYRRAVMLNDEVRGLAILRSIARLNPNDANAARELARLEKKQRNAKILHLEKLVAQGGEAALVASLVEDLEMGGVAVASDAWAGAQAIRAGVLLSRAQAARRAGAFGDLHSELRKLEASAHLLSSEDRRAFDEIQRWFDVEAGRRREGASRRAALQSLGVVVTQLEQEQIGPRKRKLEQLREAGDAIERAWRQVEHFRAELPADLAMRGQRLRDAVRQETDRTLRASRQMAFAAVAVVVIGCVIGAWYGFSLQASRALATRLQTMVAERRVTEAEAAAAATTNTLGTPALARAIRDASAFIERERGLKEQADVSVSALEESARHNFTNSLPEQTAATFARAKSASSAVAPEFKPAVEAALSRVAGAWQDFLARERSVRTAHLLTLLAPIEMTAASELQYEIDPQKVAASTRRLKSELASLESRSKPTLPELGLKQEALFRLENLRAQIDKFESDATNVFAAQKALSSSTNLSQYQNALQMLASNGFTPAGQREAAGAFAGVNLSASTMLPPLLLPNGPVSAFLDPPRPSRFPDEVLPAEREIQRRLRDEEMIHRITRVDLDIKALAADDPRRRRGIYLRGDLERRITRKAGEFYDPVESPTALRFTTKEFGALDYSLGEPATTLERDLFERTGLGRLLDPNTGKHAVSLLTVLDEINLDRGANPLFRAWLFARVCEMIDAQPSQWGAIWSPNFARDRGNLNRLGALEIQAGDWLVPARVGQRGSALTTHFDRAALHSYARQSAFFKRLLPQAMEEGLQLVGHVNAGSQVVLNSNAVQRPVFGLVAPNAPAALIMENGNSERRAQALPFSPLFAFDGDADELVNAALRSLGYAAAAVGVPETLPPILR